MPVRLVDRKERAAELLLDIGAVHYWKDKPFVYRTATSAATTSTSWPAARPRASRSRR